MTARLSRRRFLQASAGAVAGLSLTALDRAPALAQKRELTFLSLEPLRARRRRRAAQAGRGLRQAGRRHRAGGHDRAPAAAAPSARRRRSRSRATT